jgi:hypothetical protein
LRDRHLDRVSTDWITHLEVSKAFLECDARTREHLEDVHVVQAVANVRTVVL